MAVIFLASSDAGSAEHSGRIVGRLLLWLGLAPRMSPDQFAAVNHYVRKAGHLTEYAILAALLHRALARGKRRWSPGRVGAVLMIAALFAATDEFHQMFVPSRTPAGWDVLLDTIGAAVSLGLKWAWERRWRRQSSA